jgi:hypothetical protein
MTRRRVTRVLGALTTLAVIALTFEFVGTGGGTGLTAGASTVSFSCAGVSGDRAGDVGGAPKSSADLVGLLNTLPGSTGISLPVNVTASAPLKVAKGSAPFKVGFTVSLGFDSSLAANVQKYLSRSTVDVRNASINVLAESVNQTVTGKIPDQTINVASPTPTATTFSATINPNTSGRIYYRAVSVSIAIAINGSVAGQANVGTLQLVCSSSPGQNIIGSTVVQVPGAPDVADIRYQGHWGVNLFHLEDGQLIAPDSGNPVIADSLQLTSPIPIDHGLAATSQGWLGMLLGYNGYSDDVKMSVCAPPEPVKEEAGDSEGYTINFNDFNVGRLLNAHILGFQLTIGGTTKVISTSKDYNALAHLPPPLSFGQTDPNTPLSGDNILTLSSPSLSYFVRPAASVVQKAIESVVGAGNVVVTDAAAPAATAPPGTPAGYVIKYTGALTEKDGPDITISRFWSHLPNDEYGKLLALAQSAGPATGPPPLTLDQLNQRLTNPLDPYFLNFTAWEDGVAKLLSAALPGGIINALGGTDKLLTTIGSLFPKGPTIQQDSSARATIPATTTGILCTPFSVSVVTPAVPPNIVAFFTFLANGGGTQVLGKQVCTARVKVRTRIRSHGRTRYVTRYVTKPVACKKPKKKR